MKTLLRLCGIFSLAAVAFAGCHELGHIDGLGDYGGFGNTDVTGEVENVDTREYQATGMPDASRPAFMRIRLTGR